MLLTETGSVGAEDRDDEVGTSGGAALGRVYERVFAVGVGVRAKNDLSGV